MQLCQNNTRLTAYGAWVRCQLSSEVKDCTDKPDVSHVAEQPHGMREYRLYSCESKSKNER